MILENLQKNVENAKHIIRIALSHLPDSRDCQCASALRDAIATAPEHIPPDLKIKLAPIIGKYVK